MAGKNALKSVKRPGLKVIFLETNKDIALQSHENLQALVWWGGQMFPYTQTTSIRTNVRKNFASWWRK